MKPSAAKHLRVPAPPLSAKKTNTFSTFARVPFAARWIVALTLGGGLMGLAGCGDEGALPAAGQGDTPAASESNTSALSLAPEVQLVGLGDVYDQLSVTHLSFDAELYILPTDGGAAADSATVRFIFDAQGARTELLNGNLRLDAAGSWQVLVRIRPSVDDGISVRVAGDLLGDIDLNTENKAEEPAPIPAEPAPIPALPSPADNPMEPAPIPAEPAPIPAEPAPIPAHEGDEPAPIPARDKGEQTVAGNDAVYVRSRLAYEFFAGDVEIHEGDQALVVTWDVRRWLRSMLASPLGVSQVDDTISPEVGLPGAFQKVAEDFRLDAR